MAVYTLTGNIVNNIDPQTPVVTQVQPDWNATSGLGEILNKDSVISAVTSPVAGLINSTDPEIPVIEAGDLIQQDYDNVDITGGFISGNTQIGRVSPPFFKGYMGYKDVTTNAYTLVVIPSGEESSDLNTLLNFTASTGDSTITIDTTGGAIGFQFYINNSTNQNLDIVAAGGQTIVGTTSFVSGESAKIVYTDTNTWTVLANTSILTAKVSQFDAFTTYFESMTSGVNTVLFPISAPFTTTILGVSAFGTPGSANATGLLYTVPNGDTTLSPVNLDGPDNDFIVGGREDYSGNPLPYPYFTSSGGLLDPSCALPTQYYVVVNMTNISDWSNIFITLYTQRS